MSEEYRYLFTVRHSFDSDPNIDCFYEVKVPDVSGTDAKVMMGLKSDWMAEELKDDTSALSGMSMRLRVNTDLFQGVCLVRSPCTLDADELENVIIMKYKEGKLTKFLKEASI